MLERVMETLSLVIVRLEALERRKPSPVLSESKNVQRQNEDIQHEQEGSNASKPSATGLAERMFERRMKSSETRQRRYVRKFQMLILS